MTITSSCFTLFQTLQKLFKIKHTSQCYYFTLMAWNKDILLKCFENIFSSSTQYNHFPKNTHWSFLQIYMCYLNYISLMYVMVFNVTFPEFCCTACVECQGGSKQIAPSFPSFTHTWPLRHTLMSLIGLIYAVLLRLLFFAGKECKQMRQTLERHIKE